MVLFVGSFVYIGRDTNPVGARLTFKTCPLGPFETTQWIRAPVPEPKKLSSIPRPLVVERPDSHRFLSDFHMNIYTHTPPTHTQGD